MKIVLRDLYKQHAFKYGTSLPDKLLNFARALGVYGFDIHHPEANPGWKGYGKDEYSQFLLRLKKRLNNYGLKINSILIPSPHKFLMEERNAEEEIKKIVKIIQCIGEAEIQLVDLDLNLDINTFRWHRPRKHRGGYVLNAFNIQDMLHDEDRYQELRDYTSERLWPRRLEFYERVTPVAEEFNVKLALHPPDPPVPDHLIPGRLGLLDWKRLIWEIPSKNVGVKYCVGTRFESGANIINEILSIGREEKIFNVHFRNVRGTLPSIGAYEEVVLDDGDINMFEVIKALHKTGYTGSIGPDHAPEFDDDELERRIGRAYSVGYIKALLRVQGTLGE